MTGHFQGDIKLQTSQGKMREKLYGKWTRPLLCSLLGAAGRGTGMEYSVCWGLKMKIQPWRGPQRQSGPNPLSDSMRVSWRCNNCGKHPCWQASDFCRAQEDSPGQWVYLPFGIKWDFEGVWNLPTILKICHLGILIILRHLRNSRCRKGAGMPWTQKKTSLSPKTESPCWNGSTKKISCNNLYLPLVPPHIFPDHCSTLTPSGPNLFVLSVLSQLSFRLKVIKRKWWSIVSSMSILIWLYLTDINLIFMVVYWICIYS